MEKLTNYNAPQLELLIKGIYLNEDFNMGIDERYCLTFNVFEFSDHFKIRYDWFTGENNIFSGDDPVYAAESKNSNDSFFKIFKTDTLRKFTKEVLSAIDEVKNFNYED